MKKFLICLLAVLVLGLCVLTMTPSVQAEEAEEVVLYHCKCGNKHSTALTDGEITWKEGTEKCYGGCDGVILEWTPWGATSNKNAGNYYFVQDYTSARAFTSSVIAGATINVDMNGYNILVTSSARAININQGNVSFCNTKTTGGSVCGYGSAANAATIYQWGSSSLTLYGVDISCYNGGNSIKNGGAVYVGDTASFTTYGGSITGCAVSENGGTIFAKAGVNLSLNGTTVSGGTATKNGGNIYVEDKRTGTFELKSCTVFGGVATENGGNIWLGTVVADGPLAKLQSTKLYGGTAASGGSLFMKCKLALNSSSVGVGPDSTELGGVATNRGGNVFIMDAELVMNGSAVIAYGDSGSSKGGNVFIGGTAGAGKLTMNDDSLIKNGKTTGDGGNIYIETIKLSDDTYTGGQLSMGGNSSITGGDATGFGGNVYMANGSAVLIGSSYIAGGGIDGTYGTSSAKAACVDGGNVYIDTPATFVMEGSANVRNGMVHGGNQSGNFMLKGTLFIGGNAQVYGGLYGVQKRNIHMLSGASLNIYGNAKVDGGITAMGGSVILSGNATVDTYKDGRADRTIYLAKSVSVDATLLSKKAVVKIYDSASGARKIADVTADQAWIKSAVSLMDTNKLTGYVLSREKDAEGNVTLWLREASNVAAGVMAGEEGIYDYAAYTDAYNAVGETGAVVLYADVDGAVIDKNILLNLNGHHMTNVTIAEGVTLCGLDSTTDDYDCSNGYGTITLSENNKGTIATNIKTTAAQIGSIKRYLAVTEEGVTSFHRFYMGITHISLRPGVTGVGYKAVFCGDSVVQKQVESYGYNLWVADSNKYMAAKSVLESGKTITMRLQNFDVANYGESKVNATVFMQFKNGISVESSVCSYTLRSLVEQINAAVDSFSSSQMSALQTMCKNNEAGMSGWDIGNILNWTAAEAA